MQYYASHLSWRPFSYPMTPLTRAHPQTEDEIAQANSSLMYSSLFGVVLPGGTPPSAAPASDKPVPDKLNARGPSEDGKTHLPELPPLFLPPPFTPSHVVFSHLSAVASERAQILRDEAEEHIARLTEQKVAEVLKAEAALKKEVELVWTRFRDSVRLYEQAGTTGKAGLPMRRRSSVSGHARSASQPPQTSASVRISNFVLAVGRSRICNCLLGRASKHPTDECPRWDSHKNRTA